LSSYGAQIGGAEDYGFLGAAFAIGILVGSLAAAPLHTLAFGRLAIAAFLMSGVAWLGTVVVGGCQGRWPCPGWRSFRSA
jgi:hypothetical protein